MKETGQNGRQWQDQSGGCGSDSVEDKKMLTGQQPKSGGKQLNRYFHQNRRDLVMY